jgi:hypothetical protein
LPALSGRRLRRVQLAALAALTTALRWRYDVLAAIHRWKGLPSCVEDALLLDVSSIHGVVHFALDCCPRTKRYATTPFRQTNVRLGS